MLPPLPPNTHLASLMFLLWTGLNLSLKEIAHQKKKFLEHKPAPDIYVFDVDLFKSPGSAFSHISTGHIRAVRLHSPYPPHQPTR